MYEDDRLPWETDGDLPWERDQLEWESPEREGWRGEVHVNEWPENLAGPEYWLYKQQGEDEP